MQDYQIVSSNVAQNGRQQDTQIQTVASQSDSYTGETLVIFQETQAMNKTSLKPPTGYREGPIPIISGK